MWFQSRIENETGASLVIVSLATVMLFGFAALAVDVGNGMAERRRAQNTVDASVLAGGVEFNLGGTTLQDVVDQALLFADTNSPGPIPAANWTSVTRCPDSVATAMQLEFTSAELGLTPATDCISFNQTFTEMRVSLPQRDIDTYFAGVIGINTMDVTAFAHVNMHLGGPTNSPPFVVTAGHSGGDQVCLRTSPGSALLPAQIQGNGINSPPTLGVDGVDPPDPCDDNAFDPDSQFFATIKAWTYSDCKQPSGNKAIAEVIADGIDHLLGSFGDYTLGDTELIDGCSGGKVKIPQPLPNTVEMQTGFTAQVLKLGLLSTTDTTPRLARYNLQNTHTFAGEGHDNIPLWVYIRDDVNDAQGPKVDPDCKMVASISDPVTGQPDPGYDYFDLKELMISCLEGFGELDQEDIIFGGDILLSSRFAWLPLLDETTIGGLTKKLAHINAFVPVFIQKLYQQGMEAGTPDPFCYVRHPLETSQGWYMHEAGQQTNACGRSNQNVDRLAAIVLDCASLPNTICIDDTTSASPGGRPVVTLELVK